MDEKTKLIEADENTTLNSDFKKFIQDLPADKREEHRKFLNRYKRNPFVYGVVKKISYASLAASALYEYFVYIYTKEAIETLGGLLSIPKNTLLPMAIISSSILTVLDACANLTLFDAESTAKDWSEKFPDGFVKGTVRQLKDAIKERGITNTFIVIILPTVGALISYPVGAYADVEQIQAWLRENLKVFGWVLIGLELFLGTSYYVVSQYEDSLSGMNFLLNQGTERLNPPQPSLFMQFFKEKDFSTVLQCLIEQFSATISRGILFAFLAGRIAQHNDQEVMTFQIIGFTASVLAFHPARSPATYRKYYGTKDMRFDLVTEEERQQAHSMKYKDITWPHFILSKTFQLLHPIGLVQTGMVAYFSHNLKYHVAGISSLEDLGADVAIPIVFAIMTGSLAFVIHYKALSKRQLNQFVMENIENLGVEQQLDDRKSDNISIISKGFGTAFSLGTWASRILTGIPFTIEIVKEAMPVRDQVAFAVGANIIRCQWL